MQRGNEEFRFYRGQFDMLASQIDKLKEKVDKEANLSGNDGSRLI